MVDNDVVDVDKNEIIVSFNGEYFKLLKSILGI